MRSIQTGYYFTISRTDRICLAAILFILLGWEYVKYVLPVPAMETAISIVETSPPDIDERRMDGRPGEAESRRKARAESRKGGSKETLRYAAPDKLHTDDIQFPIAITEATRQELQAAGFTSFTASNITKYIASGGAIRHEKDLMKIYGMDSVQWQKVSGRITFPSSESGTSRREKEAADEAFTSIYDLNTITREELVSLPGIGDVLADRILKFRESLGGFIHTGQLKECYGLSPETYEALAFRFIVAGSHSRIAINDIDLAAYTHPYLPKKIGRILKAYKGNHGPFTDAAALGRAYPPDTLWYQQLLPYIDFEVEK